MSVSVIIPTYQRPTLLERAIASVRAQSVPVELVVVEDETPRSDYPADAHDFWCVKGVPPRNIGLDRATGDWVLTLDDDDELAPNAIDGNPTTAWSTSQYDNFPDGPKNGVGLALSLNGEFDVSKVIVDTNQTGWGAQIYVSDQPVESLAKLADWGPVRAQGTDLPRSHTFDFSGVKGRSVLLWLTQLPAGQNNAGDTEHFVDVDEVKVA